ncbi:MAG: DoxX family membrane protein [Vicinamibacteria bacterium]|nr:DoxX family membrane protein [Vicinamibacteria bacterium]
MNTTQSTRFGRGQRLALIALRFSVGWHLFLQGYGKLTRPDWSASSYLGDATGPLGSLFRALAARPSLLAFCDLFVPWALLVLGLLLMIGLATRAATTVAIALLFSFVLAQPPLLTGGILFIGRDGNANLYVNQTVIEILALIATLTFDTGRIVGLDVLLRRHRSSAASAAVSEMEQQS